MENAGASVSTTAKSIEASHSGSSGITGTEIAGSPSVGNNTTDAPADDDATDADYTGLIISVLLGAIGLGAIVLAACLFFKHSSAPRKPARASTHPNPPTYVNPTFPPPRTAPNNIGEGIQPATTPVSSNTSHQKHGQSETINPATPNSDDQVRGEGGRESSANANEYNHLHGQIEPHVYSTPSNYDVLQRQEGTAATFDCCTTPLTS